jgi:hypothetical protein
MAKSRKMKRMSRHRRQRGGAYGYTAPAFSTTGGVNVENRSSYDHCYADMRDAPAVTPAGAMQMGGACNSCGFQQMGGARQQVGGGSATGGYGFQLDNSMGKVYADLPKGACMTQSGGAAADQYGVVSYPVGYGFDKAHAVVTPSAMYLEPVGYDRTCQGGGGRRKSRKAGRKSHKAGRKSYRKSRKAGRRSVHRKH